MKCLIRAVYYCFIYFLCFRFICNEIITKCEQYCSTEPILEENDSDSNCNDTCKLNKCENGCHLYKQALESSCQILCDESGNSVSEIFYCKLGCSQALNAYVSKKKKEIGTPSAPFIVANSIKNDSVILEWKVNPILNIKYLIQWKYASNDRNDWIYYNPDEKFSSNRALITNLHPFTEYRFRVAWILFPQFSPIFSDPSLIILTKPYGVPSYPPRITSLVAVSSNHISLTWETPRFPNGPILAYYLYINEETSDKPIIKVINAKHSASDTTNNPNAMHYMFTDLKPGTVYSVSVSCLNEVGEGPKLSRRIETPQRTQIESTTSNVEDAYLILASEKNVIKQSRDIMQLPEIMFRLNDYSAFDNITSLAVHVWHKYIFVSDTSGTIRRICFRDSRNIQVKTIYKPTKKINSKSIRLSIDWLNEKLYFSDETSITRIDLNGNNRRDVITGFTHMINELHVDPYNGFLYYTYADSMEGGIYRVDMCRFAQKTLRFYESTLIYKEPSVNVFTIDYSNYRIYIPKFNSILSLSMGGEDANDIRKNHVDAPQFTNVINIVHFNETFFWTTGVEVFKEEYDEVEKKYYHNAFALEGDTFVSLQIFHQKCQPLPIPHNPIDNLEVVFSDTTAKVHWNKPSLLGGMAQGAWQEWLYEIRIEDHVYQNYTEIDNITETSCVLHELSPNTLYKISVRAYSKSGRGPWCPQFVGSTFKSIDLRSNYPHILWGTKDGVLQSNIVGDDLVSILNTIKLNRMAVKDITWFKDMLFINANHTSLFAYNTSTYQLMKLPNILSIKSIEIDWITPMIYFSNPINQMISRMNIDGTHIETLPMITLAKEIAIDANQAKLYWITDYNLECSRLNGFNHKIIFQLKHFSGKQLMSLTLDLEHRNIYWIVKSFEEIVLYKADLVDDDTFEKPIQFIESIGYLRDVGVRGSLKYFDKRLFFVHQFNTVLITDLKGKNRAFLQIPGLQEMDTVNIVDPSLHVLPKVNNTQLNVIPNRVLPSSIRIEGKWDNFSVIWTKVDNVNYGEVYYDLSVNVIGYVDTRFNLNRNIITKNTIYNYPSNYKLQPYSLLKVYIKSFTYWSSGEATSVDVYTPMSTPSKPQNPRVFITNNKGNITAEFRWMPSINPNGLIKYYKVNVWYDYDLLGRIDHSKVTASALSHKTSNLRKDKIYSFQVQAYTEAGGGPLSDIVQINSSISLSVPNLIIIKNDAINVFDVDLLRETDVGKKVMNAIAVSYLRNEKTIFWIEEDKILKSFNVESNQTIVLNTMNGISTSLTADWVSRNLYWSEIDSRENKSKVWRLDLNSNQKPEIVFQRSKVIIKSLEMYPFTNSLFWSEMHSSEEGILKKCNLKNIEISSLFGKHNEPESGCNCPYLPVVGSAISIDLTNEKNPKIIFTDARKGIIWSSDLNGCKCEQAINLRMKTAFVSVGADQYNYYWSTLASKSIFKIRKQTSFNDSYKFATEVTRNVKSMKVYQQQSYSEVDCLSPLPYDSKVKLANKGYSFMVLVIPKIRRPHYCENFSLASIEYKIYYGKVFANKTFECDLSLNRCKTLHTYNQTVVLTNLEPFTNYSVRVEAKNFFSVTPTLPGPEVVFDTKEWHPSPPANVTVKQMTPFHLVVSWQPPLHPNGDYLRYEIRWFSDSNNGSQFVQTTNITTPVRNKMISFELKDESLLPMTKYWFTVRAVSPGGDLYSDSIPTELTTDEYPNNLTAVSRGARFISFSWLSPQKKLIRFHTLEAYNDESLKWIPIATHSTNTSTKYNFNITQLRSNTNYHFRLSLQYFYKNYTIPWPINGRFTIKTKGEVPQTPSNLLVIDMKNGHFKITWNSIDNMETKAYIYELFQREEGNENWVRVYKGSNNFWITNKTDHTDYVYKVRSMNEFGESNFSEQSMPSHYVSFVQTKTSTTTIVAYAITALVTASILAFLFYVFYKVKKQECEKKSLQELDIVALPELPSHHHENNDHYLAGDINIEELNSVPQITRNQVKLNKFLGSGAFAEVYEGLAHDLEGSFAVKVAVKTLRSGATESQKADFLKEAKLMGNFKHPHILQLLGICLDNNPFLVFELMEGGDLLSYLRLNRPEVDKPSSLTMDDLLRICVDVARGCEYLEDMHFVHRDLAARNCLVSSFSREERIVKIGDFGLARDIYKNDYYRKEGEGLLPVRWMAPESLVDGVFTTQSDIWSFAVLVWEVLTLGQHPYTARANVEVWNYVRSGGRLDIPSNCPEELSLLLNQCWNYKPELRPSFSFCLKFLEELQKKLSSLNMVITMVHNQNYVISRNSRVSTLSSAPTEASMITSDSEYNASQTTSKYSSNLDQTVTTDTDGYEVPVSTTTTTKRTIVRRRVIVRRVVKQEVTESTGNSATLRTSSIRRQRRTRRRNCSPPPTYSQIFSALQRCTVPHSYSNCVKLKDFQQEINAITNDGSEASASTSRITSEIDSHRLFDAIKYSTLKRHNSMPCIINNEDSGEYDLQRSSSIEWSFVKNYT